MLPETDDDERLEDEESYRLNRDINQALERKRLLTSVGKIANPFTRNGDPNASKTPANSPEEML